MQQKAISLSELLGQVKETLKTSLPWSWWLVAEIYELKVNYAGHCYLELIEKSDTNESIKAKVRATIWSSVYRMLQPYFETTTQTKLEAGIRVMIKVNAEFHELYGFSLNITDIEPSYTVGELARQKLEIINRLKAEGVFEMNRSLTMPVLPSKIAVISSSTAAGLGDFMDQLPNNSFGYKFYLKLFPAIMQGAEAEQSIIAALDRVYKWEDFFDAVVIIRGGGAKSDLHCFNSYWLNYHICQFPLPVLTGIGHEQDETIADLVANKRLKTPTAVAEFLINCYQQAEDHIHEKSAELYDLVTQKIQLEKDLLNDLLTRLKPSVKEKLTENHTMLRLQGSRLNGSVKQLLVKESGLIRSAQIRIKAVTKEFVGVEKHKLDLLQKRNEYLDPYLILKRGYSITYLNGKIIKDPLMAKSGDEIESRLAKGILKSKTF